MGLSRPAPRTSCVLNSAGNDVNGLEDHDTMDIPQLDLTNIFLGILAGLAVIQMIGLIVAVLWVRSYVSRLTGVAQDLESRYVQPVVGQVQQLLTQTREAVAELQPIVTRAKNIVGGVEAQTKKAMMAVDAVGEHVDTIVHSGLQQVRAIEHGIRRGVEALVSSQNDHRFNGRERRDDPHVSPPTDAWSGR
jgi:hypothetical protein